MRKNFSAGIVILIVLIALIITGCATVPKTPGLARIAEKTKIAKDASDEETRKILYRELDEYFAIFVGWTEPQIKEEFGKPENTFPNAITGRTDWWYLLGKLKVIENDHGLWEKTKRIINDYLLVGFQDGKAIGFTVLPDKEDEVKEPGLIKRQLSPWSLIMFGIGLF